MIKTYTCIICPVGCDITVNFDQNTKIITNISGATCKKGNNYIEQELTNPQRTIQTSIKITNGILPLASVKTSKTIPKKYIFEIMDLIKTIELDAPVRIGTVAYKNILNLGIDIIVTKEVPRMKVTTR